jgi:hypothetical protein
MRELIIERLVYFIMADKAGIPRYFDCDPEEYITDAKQFQSMTDDELLNCFEAAVGFDG